MSKLSRKEFRNLLTEWNTYITEKNIKDFGNFTAMTNDQMKFVKSVPVNLNLYAVGDYYVDKKNSLTISYVLLQAMKNSSNFLNDLSGEKSIVLKKEALPEMIRVLEFLLGESSFSYHDRYNKVIQDKSIKENSKSNIKKMKEDLKNLTSDKHGIMLYFPRMDSYADSMADGSINKIGNVADPAVWKSSLLWELKHDVFHYFEEILDSAESKNYNSINTTFRNNLNIYQVLINFVVPDQELTSADSSIRLGSSLYDGDNFATVVSYIRSLKNSEANKKSFVDKCLKIASDINITLSKEEESALMLFFEKAHACYDEVEDILKDKIVIQMSHG